MITRIAPTPSGFLHIGNIYAFLLTWLWARKNRHQILLRIDDLDRARVRPEYIADIFGQLDWLQLDYDLGPSGPDDFERNFSQLRRMDLYRQTLAQLHAQEAIYPCTCSRNTATPCTCHMRKPLHVLPHVAQALPRVGETAWRFRAFHRPLIYQDFNNQAQSLSLPPDMQHFVVLRKDLLPAYQVASLTDDLHFGVTAIVRGQDLLPSTAAQLALAHYLPNGQAFLQTRFLHHALITQNGEKLSKSQKAPSLADWRKQDASPAAVYRWFSGQLQLPEAATLPDLLSAFSALDTV